MRRKVRSFIGLTSGYKTYAAAIGAVALAIVQFSQGEYIEGIKSLVGALAVTGLRHAISKSAWVL